MSEIQLNSDKAEIKEAEALAELLKTQADSLLELNKLISSQKMHSSIEDNAERQRSSQDCFIEPDTWHEIYPHVSSISIQPIPITLDTVLKGTSGSTFGTPNFGPNLSTLLCCCYSKDHKNNIQYAVYKKRVKSSYSKSSKFFHHLSEDLETLDGYLKFDLNEGKGQLSSDEIPKTMNVISANLWFATFLLARELDQSNELDRSDYHFFRNQYEKLMSHAVWLRKQAIEMRVCLEELDHLGMTRVYNMKEAITGYSRTDLGNCETSPNDDFFLDGPSVSSMKSQHMHRFNILRVASGTTSFFRIGRSLDVGDGLNDRMQLDVFAKNVTKVGWKNFKENFFFESRMKIIKNFLVHILEAVHKMRRSIEATRKKLKSGTMTRVKAFITCNETLLPHIRQMKKHVKITVKNGNFGAKDFEFLRFHVYSTELHLNAAINKGKLIQSSILDIVRTTTLCCDLLERAHQLYIPHYEFRRESMADKQVDVTKDSAISSFYLHPYGLLLKQIPISFRILQFVLAKKIGSQERHSGADFQTRFFNI